MRQGIALVLSAPSGAGKSTLTQRLRREYPEFGYSISCTTRPPRPGEVHGREYFFTSREEFERMRDAGHFAEWAEVHGNFYGTPLKPVLTMLKDGIDVLFDVDVQGAGQLKSTLPEAVFIFIVPPAMTELKHRLTLRGADDPASLRTRLQNSIRELSEAFWYDAIIVNDNLEQAFRDLEAIYRTATLSPTCNRAILERLLEEAGNIV